MTNQELFYQESGKIDIFKQSISYAICSGIALILGYIYTIATIVIPVVYFNLLFTIGFGLALSFICVALVRISHNRSRKSRIIQAIIIGLLANYFQWVAYITYAYNGEIPTFDLYLSNLDLILNPKSLFATIAEINSIGFWSILRIAVNGFALTFIWILEFFIIIACPIIAIINIRVHPYSELLEKWYKKHTLFNDFESMSTDNELIRKLKTTPLKTIDSLERGTGLRHSKVHIYYLKNEEKQYIKFEKIFIEGQGKGKMNSSLIIDNFQINKIDAESILDKYENAHDRFKII